LSLPKDEDVGAWLSRLYKKYGYAKGLMAELVLLTAVRREEAASWRVDTLPKDKANWKIINLHAPYENRAVLVTIRYGCKGSNYGEDHGDKIGPEGTIKVPLPLADKIHEYRTKKRPHALLNWVKAGKSLQEQRTRQSDSVHLFLDEDSGSRLKAQALYDAWTGVELPFKGWSPHLGRDWWACSTLWVEMRKHEHLLKTGLDIPHALLESTAIGVIRLQIQPQLRHVSPETTLMYLVWVSDMLGFNLSIDYENDLIEDEA